MKIAHKFSSTLLVAFVLMIGAAVPTAAAGDPTLGKACATTETAACSKCGDGKCTPQCGENAQTCPRDCGGGSDTQQLACGKCGDNKCTPQCGENATTCPKDCGYSAKNALTLTDG